MDWIASMQVMCHMHVCVLHRVSHRSNLSFETVNYVESSPERKKNKRTKRKRKFCYCRFAFESGVKITPNLYISLCWL